MRFEKEFREAFPETVGEADKKFDQSNYCDWLESLVEKKITSNNSDYTKCADEVLSIINFSRNSSHGRKIIECIKRHFD